LVADVDRQLAGAQQVTGAHQEAEEVHGVLPARGAVLTYVGLQLLALAERVAGERLVGPQG